MSSEPNAQHGAIAASPAFASDAVPFASAKLVVGVPVYNECRYIAETLRALAAQDHPDFRVLISDNASDDGTGEQCQSFANGDDRFVYTRQRENIGAVSNFEFCLQASSSEYFIWCGAHDVLSGSFLSAMSSLLDRDQSAAIAFGTRVAVDEESRPIDGMRGDDGYIYRFSDSRYLRYIQAVCCLSDCVIVNGLIRRKWLDGFRIRAVKSCDMVIIGRLLYFGQVRYDFSAEYRRRYFSRRTTSPAKRMHGIRPATGMHDRDLVEYFISDFASITGNGLLRGWRVFLLEKIVFARYLSPAAGYIHFLTRLFTQPAHVLSTLKRQYGRNASCLAKADEQG